MVNSIIDAISIELNKIFGDDYEIYSENVKQGLKEPCFFILLIKPSSTPKLGSRSLREYNFDIHYFPKSKDEQKREINEVMESLTEDLEYIQTSDGLIRGTDIHAEVIDDVLHFFISYKIHVIKQIPVVDSMESLQVNQSIKR